MQKTESNLEQTFPIFAIEEDKEEYKEENEVVRNTSRRQKEEKADFNDIDFDTQDGEEDLTIHNDSNPTLSIQNPQSMLNESVTMEQVMSLMKIED